MKKHTALMLVCCLIPLAVAGILYYAFNLKTYAILVVMLLCPILHYFMMKDMHNKHTQTDNLNKEKSFH